MNHKIYYLKLVNSRKVALVDEKWYNICKDYKWRLNSRGYAKSRGIGLLHRFILKLKKGDGKSVHHVNKDKLDNRTRNLRILTEKEHAELHRRKK